MFTSGGIKSFGRGKSLSFILFQILNKYSDLTKVNKRTKKKASKSIALLLPQRPSLSLCQQTGKGTIDRKVKEKEESWEKKKKEKKIYKVKVTSKCSDHSWKIVHRGSKCFPLQEKVWKQRPNKNAVRKMNKYMNI